MRIVVEKSTHCLTLWLMDQVILRCRVALGHNSQVQKRREGDGATPEGIYQICLVKMNGKYGRSLGLNYPNMEDARFARENALISLQVFNAIEKAHLESQRPPWGTALGGEIYIHEGSTKTDWTQGCIAISAKDMDVLFPYWQQISEVEINE